MPKISKQRVELEIVIADQLDLTETRERDSDVERVSLPASERFPKGIEHADPQTRAPRDSPRVDEGHDAIQVPVDLGNLIAERLVGIVGFCRIAPPMHQMIEMQLALL